MWFLLGHPVYKLTLCVTHRYAELPGGHGARLALVSTPDSPEQELQIWKVSCCQLPQQRMTSGLQTRSYVLEIFFVRHPISETFQFSYATTVSTNVSKNQYAHYRNTSVHISSKYLTTSQSVCCSSYKECGPILVVHDHQHGTLLTPVCSREYRPCVDFMC